MHDLHLLKPQANTHAWFDLMHQLVAILSLQIEREWRRNRRALSPDDPENAVWQNAHTAVANLLTMLEGKVLQ
jgi:hypothetical protein